MFQELAINGKEREISLENKAKDILLFQLPKAPLQKGDPSKLQIKKKQLFRPRKVVFSFSLPDTLGSRHEAFQVPFPAAQSATAKGDPSKLQIKKQLFRPRKVVFSFSLPDTLGSRHEAFQVPFPAAQSATAKGDPSNCKLKNNFSGSEKLFFPKV